MKYDLQIEGMTCLACARTVEQALASAQGVEHAAVSYPTRRATVVAGLKIGSEALREAVARVGYQATVLGDETADTPPPHVTAPAAALSRTSMPTSARLSGEAPDDRSAQYDLLIVGTGGAGVAAAIRASELGASAAIVERADVIGGTCVNVGCIPSKNLIEAAAHYHAARTGFPGLAPCEPQLAWEQVLRQKRELVESLRQQK